MQKNFEKNNFGPFKEKIFTPNDFKFKKILEEPVSPASLLTSAIPGTSGTSVTSSIPRLIPLIPAIYFNPSTDDNIGSDIINAFNIININLKQLETIKKYILVILEISKFSLEKIPISKDKYKLKESNLIRKFTNNLNETFKDQTEFIDFIDKFVKNNNSILDNNRNIEPQFYTIFQNEFNGNTSKAFFISLFKKYLTIRSKIIKYITSNNGLLAFNLFFDISQSEKYKKIKHQEIVKTASNNNIDYDNFILYGNNLNTNNDAFKAGDYVVSKTNSSIIKIITRIDFDLYPDAPYFLIDDSSSSTIIQLSDDDFKAQYVKKPGKIIKKNLIKKIRNFDSLYSNILSEQYIKDEHNEKIHLYYDQLKESINSYVGSDAKFNLYNATISALEVDFNSIQFIFNYVYPIDFHKAVGIHYEIKKEILFMINKFETNYDNYIDWYNMFMRTVSLKLMNFDESSVSDFKYYFDKIMEDDIENIVY